MKRAFSITALAVITGLTVHCKANEGTVPFKVDGHDLVSYQATPMTNPKGGDKFFGSNFIHPLKTPSGFVITEIQPDDHLHHFGLWWPWKYIETEGRKVLCWELQNGDGIVQSQGSRETSEGFTANSIYVDRKAKDGPETLLNETINVKRSQIMDTPVRGYTLDLEIVHETAVDRPIIVAKYRYSGLTLRGTHRWHRDNSFVLTSEGKDYDASNFTRAKWVQVEGDARAGKTAGILMMSCPNNQDHPELLRTWNKQKHNGAIFINFNTVQAKSWVFEPGKKYTRNFRVFVYDGKLSAEDAEQLWKQYTTQ
jgi:hypothetical protein